MISIGEQKIAALYCGGAKIKQAYAGSSLVFEAKKPSRLPEGYTEVEYIESTGTQYINSGVVIANTYDIDAVIAHTFDSTSVAQYLFGVAMKSGTKTYIFAIAAYQSNMITGRNVTSTLNLVPVSPARKLHYQVLKTRTFMVDGQQIGTLGFLASVYNPALYILAYHPAGTTVASNFCSAKLYSFDIKKDDGSYLRQFVPCVNPENQVGLYDLANANFYANSGTGAFLAGPAV